VVTPQPIRPTLRTNAIDAALRRSGERPNRDDDVLRTSDVAPFAFARRRRADDDHRDHDGDEGGDRMTRLFSTEPAPSLLVVDIDVVGVTSWEGLI
jgi:hypothetical protein